MNVFPIIISDCTLLSLLQLINCSKRNVGKKRKRPLLSWGNTDYPTRIRANVSIKHVFSMNFTHFHEIFLHQVFIHCNRPNGSKYANTDKTKTGQRFHGETLCILLNSS